MPILRNAKKALRQSKKHEKENLVIRKAYKKTLKETRKAVEAQAKDLQEKIKLTQKKLDKAAKKGVIKKKTAARYLSRLTKKANKITKK